MKNKRKTNDEKGETNKMKVVFFIAFALITLIVLFLFSTNVSALGITPGRVTLGFEPGAEKQVNLSIVNTEHKAMNVSLKVEGEWASYVELNQTILEFSPQEEMKVVSYSVSFPQQAGVEGVKVRITASENAVSRRQGTSVGVVLSVEHQLYIRTNVTDISKESKELNITRVFVENYGEGQTAQFKIEVRNPFPRTIVGVYATMVIFDRYGTLRSQFNSTPTDIGPDSSKIIEAYWDTYGFEQGDYGGELTVYYDNQTRKQGLVLLLRPDRIEVNFGKFQFQEPEPLVPEELIEKMDHNLMIVIGAIVLLIAINIILFVFLRKKAHKKKGRKA